MATQERIDFLKECFEQNSAYLAASVASRDRLLKLAALGVTSIGAQSVQVFQTQATIYDAAALQWQQCVIYIGSFLARAQHGEDV